MKILSYVFTTITLCFFLLSCNDNTKSSESTTKKETTDTITNRATTEGIKETTDIPPPPSKEFDTTKQPMPNEANPGNFGYLKELNGSYPNDVKLLQKPELRSRLEKLLGSRFKFMEDTWAVETPMQYRNNIFIAEGCQAHNCDATNFIIVVDLEKNLVYAGIREEGVVKKYSEDGSPSKALNLWAERN